MYAELEQLRRDQAPTKTNFVCLNLTIIVTVGVLLRMLVPLRGHNFDVESWRIVADIVAAGGNVYADTDRYNYGPVWFHILQVLDAAPWFSGDGLTSLRWKVALFLTFVDLGILFVLVRQYSLKIGALFFLNPVSILITGYHSQFDNLAVLLGLGSVVFYHNRRSEYALYLCAVGIGLSLCVKHILFLFPLWMALKDLDIGKRLIVLLVPYGIFLASFAWYLPDGMEGIIRNVFLYRSLDNAPLWSLLFPVIWSSLIPKVVLFVAALFALGLLWRGKSPLDSINLYLISLVVFSSAVANQYLAICAPSIATMWNWAYALYSVVGFVFLLVDGNGLHMEIAGLRHFEGYQWLVVILATGLLVTTIRQVHSGRIVAEVQNLAGRISGLIGIQGKTQGDSSHPQS